jgi:cytoskeletal protein RodZ
VFEIGNSLREARERQGRTFADLEHKTEIRTRYLKALEEEQFSLLPANAYTKGFLRVYADELGLDGQLYVDEFNSRFSVSEVARVPARRQERRASAQHQRRIATGAVVISLAIIVVITGLIAAALTSKSPSQSVPNLTTSTNQNAKTTRLEITAVRGDSFVDAHAVGQGGKLLFGGTLVKGHHITIHAPTIWVRVSAAQNLRWTLPGGISASSGNRVGPKTLLFTPNGQRYLPG